MSAKRLFNKTTMFCEGKLKPIPSNQRSDVDIRSVNTQKTKPCEVVSASVATGNRARAVVAGSIPAVGGSQEQLCTQLVTHVIRSPHNADLTDKLGIAQKKRDTSGSRNSSMVPKSRQHGRRGARPGPSKLRHSLGHELVERFGSFD